ncbi:tRNA (adenosine(37)-N6)-dimethylallyltransferase MiaA [Patiriisocius marinus]|uniref:tRNA dimethylallyltransferase n=1 Tax=Patiriisocius marinus TaxID=1397112 RepID=A0A5J4J4A6_9FLAO|nr:tRNA (adenosine(37)-N6)-dimethylallyltransferase MiaA [Patiriisocius marinus]GER60868.1 tRNA dimethylallyltransferase [Patiriisocius marinus]
MPKPLLICVVGATAIGKTALAIKIANAFSTEILSADSRQFFKEMAIGTAVPSTEELSQAKHHFIQNISVVDTYTVGDFERDALAKLDSIFQKKNIAVLVGGSGLYVDAVVKGLDNFPKVDPKIRIELNKDLEQFGITSLQEKLKEVDFESFKTIDIHNPRRVIRALELFIETGKQYSYFLNENKVARPFNTLYIGINAPRETIYDRINKRVDIMIEEGLVDEAKGLLKYRELNALQTVGYRELFQHFDGEITLEEAISEIKKNTRRFAKRQGTWFRKNETINWFDFDADFLIIEGFIKTKSAL